METNTQITSSRSISFLSFLLGVIQILIVLSMGVVLVLAVSFINGSKVTSSTSFTEVEVTKVASPAINESPKNTPQESQLSEADLEYVNSKRAEAGIDPLGPTIKELVESEKSTTAMRIAGPLIAFVWLGTLLFMVNKLFKFTRSTKNGQVFTKENAERLRMFGIICLTWGVVSPIVNSLYQNWTRNTELSFELNTPGFWLWAPAGLFVIIIAEAFRHGVALNEFDKVTV